MILRDMWINMKKKALSAPEPSPKKVRADSNRRLWFYFTVFTFLWLVPIASLVNLQIINKERYSNMAFKQQTRNTVLKADRGKIYDRNGNMIVNSITVYDASMDVTVIREQQEKWNEYAIENGTVPRDLIGDTVAYFTSVLPIDATELRQKLEEGERTVTVSKGISFLDYRALRDLKKDFAKKEENKKIGYSLVGISFTGRSKRDYVYGNLAANLLGFTGSDNQGLEGIEALYDTRLKGIDGTVTAMAGPTGQHAPFEEEIYIDPQEGDGIVLTIDVAIQQIIENTLKEAVARYGCRMGGCGIAMDPNTGEILAMATVPDYNPDAPFVIDDAEFLASVAALPKEEQNAAETAYLQTLWRNRALVDTYEPGSVFKMITASIALEEQLVSLTDTFSCDSGRTIDGILVKCWSTGDRHGVQTIAKGLQNSCNSVFMDIGARIGQDTFKKYLSAYGFGAVTHVGFGNEATGFLFDKYTPIDLAVASFGQSNTVTPIQMITAASAVVNGGFLMQPRFVKAFVNNEGKVKETTEPKQIRQVISEATSATMREMLEDVVKYGTAKNAAVAGYRIGGKTGTSEKQPRGMDKKIASFCGFLPINDPKIVVLVLLDEPTPGVGGAHTGQGGQIAAPTVGSILKDIAEYWSLPQEGDIVGGTLVQKNVPELLGLSLDEAKTLLSNSGFGVKVVGGGDSVVTQIPPGNTMVADGTRVVLYTGDASETVTVPDLTDYGPADCQAILESNNLNFTSAEVGAGITESSRAIAQTPAAGTVVAQGTVVSVEFREYATD